MEFNRKLAQVGDGEGRLRWKGNGIMVEGSEPSGGGCGDKLCYA